MFSQAVSCTTSYREVSFVPLQSATFCVQCELISTNHTPYCLACGSQSVLGQFPDAPVALLMSMECDLYPKTRPELADKIDGAIGEGSKFHETHGYEHAKALAHLDRIGTTLTAIFDRAAAENRPTGEVADRMAEEIFRR